MKWLLKQREEFSNREGLAPYDFTLYRSRSRQGVSAMVRIRNEEAKISYCLRSILPIFDEIVVVDNGSDDDTASIVKRVRESEDPTGKMKVFSYPHGLSRFGSEHDRTPEDSVHSAVYYTNWAISQCSFRYVCKWDGDMVLSKKARPGFTQFLQHLRTRRTRCWVLAGQTVYRDLGGDFYLAVGEINREIEIFPYGYRSRFVKAAHWERLSRPLFLRKGEFRPVCFYELKFTDEDEFSHWSNRDWPSERKQREWQNYWLVRNGTLDEKRFERLPRTFLDDEVGADPWRDLDNGGYDAP